VRLYFVKSRPELSHAPRAKVQLIRARNTSLKPHNTFRGLEAEDQVSGTLSFDVRFIAEDVSAASGLSGRAFSPLASGSSEYEWEVPFDILNSVPEVLGHPVRH
jgi:hypothetical protein